MFALESCYDGVKTQTTHVEILHAYGSNVQLISTIRMTNLSKLAYLLNVQSAQKYQELLEQRYVRNA